MKLLSWDCIIKKNFFKRPVTYYLTAYRMSLVSIPSSNGWTIPLMCYEHKEIDDILYFSSVQIHICILHTRLLSINNLGCSDFDFFHILRYKHPSQTPWGPKDLEIAQKKFQLHPWPAEIFGKNRKLRFFGLVSKFNFRSPIWQIFTIFQHVLFIL